MRLIIAAVAVAALAAPGPLLAPALGQQPKEKDKQEPAPALADSQQGFSFDYCRDLLAKAKGGDAAVRPNEGKIKTCMTTGKID